MKKIFTILGVFSGALLLNAQTNLISNGDFETWADSKPTGWFIPAGVTLTQSTVVHGGSFAAGLPSPATGNRTISPAVDIPVEAGKTYVFSGWYLDNTPNARFKYWNQFRNTADTGANAMQAPEYSTDSPEWKFFTAEAMPNPGATVARPGLRVYPENNTGGADILLDDIMFYEKVTAAVSDVNTFDKQVKMNTIINNELTVILPARATVNIYTADGRLVSSDRVNSGESINTSSLTKGNYLVVVDNGTAKVSRKVIKK